VKLVGLAAIRGAIDTFPLGLAAGAVRVVTAREELFCTTGFIICPAAVWMLADSVATRQNTANRDFFINSSAY
jgi:hypothetical protein